MLSREAEIGIIGAGCSGITAAYYLRKAGFSHITIIEKEDRIGGKCCTINYKGRTYELGAMMGVSTYENIIHIMDELGISNDGPVLYRGFYDCSGKKIQQIKRNDSEEFRNQYEKLSLILKEYEDVLKPGLINTDKRLCVPFSEWCDNNGIPLMKEIYRPPFTAFGYGFIEEIPAAYVLKFLDYNTLQEFIKITRLITWVNGSQSFLEKLAQGFDIRLSSPVLKITRGKKVKVETELETLNFDKLIITNPLDEARGLINLNEEESKLFSQIQYINFKVFAFVLDGIPKVSGFIPEHLNREHAGHLMVWYYRWQDAEMNDLITVYSIAEEEMSTKECMNIVEEDLKRMGVKVRGLYTHKSWKYFPHVNCKALESGFYERLEALQGVDNIYYAGEIMSFSCMEECATYSRYLIEKYFK